MTSTSKFTKGPWKTGREDMQTYDGSTGEAFTNIYHATLHDGKHHVTGEPLPLTIGRAEGKNNKANARLIAASPDLLEACKLAAESYCSMNCPSQWRTADYPSQPHVEACAKIRAAIARAEGQGVQER